MNSQLDNSRYARSILSNSTRRQVLWNVLQPGDPYDIKKSMIAKLPGDKKIFMGDHLQMVCLLQAAQIERLCQFLDDYKLKFREIERSILDRHSYEVQIKELTQRLADQQSLRIESSKLKQFIKRQGSEIDSLQKNTRDNRQTDDNYKNMYEKSLERINQLLIENKDLRQVNQEYRLQLQNSILRMEALQKAKNKEIQDLKFNFAQYSKESYESSLNSLRQKYEGEIKRYEYELKRQKEFIDAKNMEINEIYRRNEEMTNIINQLKGKGDQHYDLERQIAQYQNRFVLFGQEIERLNITLRDYTSRLQQSELKRRELQRRIEKYEFEMRDEESKVRSAANEIVHLKEVIKRFESSNKKIEESQQFIIQYEAKINDLARDYEQVNTKLRFELETTKKLREEIGRLSYENSRVKLLEKENNELKEGGLQINILRRKIAELQNQIVIFNQQIERLTDLHKAKDAEFQKFRMVAFENEALRSKIKQTEYSVRSQYQIEITRIKNQYEGKYQILKRSQGSEYQSKTQMFQNERDRLKDLLRQKNEEGERQRAKIYEMQALINRSQIDISVKIKNYEAAIAAAKRENEQLYTKLKQLTDNERRLFEFQGKLSQYERQLQRLASVLKSRQEEIITLRTKVRETEGQNTRLESDVGRKLALYQQNINQLLTENQELKKRLMELVNESNQKLKEASQEIQRLGLNIHSKQEEKNQLESKLRQLAQENQVLKQNLQKVVTENDELRKRLNEAEIKINSLVNDSSSSIRTIAAENDNLKRQLIEMKSAITAYEAQVTKRITLYEQNINVNGSENEEMRKRVVEYQSKLSLLSQQLQRLHQKMRIKTEQMLSLQANYKSLSLEHDNLKKHFKEYELSVTNKLEGEVVRKYSTYEQNIQGLGRENEELKRIIADYEAKLNRFAQQNEKLTINLKQSVQDSDNLKRQINQTESKIGSFQIDVKKTLATYESNLQSITLQKDQLQRRLAESDFMLKQKTQELRISSKQNDSIKRQFKEYQFSVTQKLEGDVARKYTLYEQTIAKLNQQNDQLRRKIQELGGDMGRKLSESETKLAMISQQYEKIKSNLNFAVQENQALKKKLEDYTVSISNYENEVNRRMVSTDQKYALLNKQNEELRRKIPELSDAMRKLAESESRVAMLSQELERATHSFNRLTQQHDHLQKQFNDKNSSISSYEIEVTKRVSAYEQKLVICTKQNEELKRRLQDLGGDASRKTQQLQNRLLMISQEMERLTQNLKLKQQEFNKLQLTNRDMGKRIGEYENKLIFASQELERLNGLLRLKNEEIVKLDGNCKLVIKENDDLRRKIHQYRDVNSRIPEYETKIRQILQQNEKLQFVLRNKTDELGNVEMKLRQIVQQMQIKRTGVKP